MYLKEFEANWLEPLDKMLHSQVQEFLPGTALGNIKDFYAGFRKQWNNPAKSNAKASELFHVTEVTPVYKSFLMGLDLPILVTNDSNSKDNNQAPKKEIVMILAQDPLRHTRDFDGDQYGGRLILGTPFALHSQRYRQGRTRLYQNLVNNLIDKYDVYLTDVSKLGKRTISTTKDGKWISHQWMRDVSNETRLLKYELTIAPKKIILLGKVAETAFSSVQMEGDVNLPHYLSLPHPGAWSSEWEPILTAHFGAGHICSVANKTAYINHAVNSWLGSNSDRNLGGKRV